MPDQIGPYYANIVTQAIAGNWINLAGAIGSANFVSPVSSGADQTGGKTESGYLFLRDFRFTLPRTAHIVGIKVDMSLDCLTEDPSTFVDHAFLTYLGTPVGVDRGIGHGLSFGSNADEWGLIITPDMVNDASFGIAIDGFGVSNTDDIYCGGAAITVYFATPATDPNYACFKSAV